MFIVYNQFTKKIVIRTSDRKSAECMKETYNRLTEGYIGKVSDGVFQILQRDFDHPCDKRVIQGGAYFCITCEAVQDCKYLR